MLLTDFVVDSPALVRGPDSQEASYVYERCEVDVAATPPVVRPVKTVYSLKTDTRVPKMG